MSDWIEVEVAYARPDEQVIVTLKCLLGMTAQGAVEASGLRQRFIEINDSPLILGIFGKAVTPDTVLNAHDRVEIYRPLLADPKEVRRTRVQRGRIDGAV